MASTNHRIEPLGPSDRGDLCEMARHQGETPAVFILSYDYIGGKNRCQSITARRPACLRCSAVFARAKDLPIPPYKRTIRQKITEMKATTANKCEFARECEIDPFQVWADVVELLQLIEVTYGL